MYRELLYREGGIFSLDIGGIFTDTMGMKELSADAQELLKLAYLYCKRTGVALATVSTRAANDGKFFDSIADGSDCTINRKDKIKKWFEQHMPKESILIKKGNGDKTHLNGKSKKKGK